MYLFWIFLKRGWLRHVSYRLAFVLGIVNVLIGVISFFYLSRLIQAGNTRLLEAYGNNPAAFLIVGTTFNTFIAVALRAFALQVQNDQQVGVLEHILMGRVGLTKLAIYSGVYDLVWSAVVAVASYVLLSVVFGVPFAANPAAVLVFLTSILGIAGLGLVSAGVVLVTKQGDPVALTIGLLTGFLSGVYYPPDVLPSWLSSLSYVLPTTYGLRALRRALINGDPIGALVGDLTVLLAFAAVTIPVGVWSFHWGFLKARRDGTLSEY